MCTVLYCGVRSRNLACKELMLVRDAGFVTGTESFVVSNDLLEVCNGLSAVSRIMSMVKIVITDGDGFLSFSSGTVQVFV